MKSFFAELRSLIFGDTWTLPVSVAGLVGLALVIREVAPGAWDTAGGPMLLSGVLACLILAVRA